jgi:hypothetical protein
MPSTLTNGSSSSYAAYRGAAGTVVSTPGSLINPCHKSACRADGTAWFHPVLSNH